MTTPEASIPGNLREYEGYSTDSHVPIPDPTRLTTQLVDRTIAAFREVFEVRVAEMDRAILLVATQMTKISTDAEAQRNQLRSDVDRQVLALREFIMSQIENSRVLSMEKFEAANTRFIERNSRIEQAAQESRMSLDAALSAAKEAVSEQNKANAQAIAKSELATQKQIDAMAQLMTNSNKSLEDKIGDLKTRLDRGEGHDTGSTEARTDKRLDVGTILQALAVIATVVGLVIVAFHR